MTDSTTAFFAIKNHSVQGLAMEPLRELLLLAAQHDVKLTPHWIS